MHSWEKEKSWGYQIASIQTRLLGLMYQERMESPPPKQYQVSMIFLVQILDLRVRDILKSYKLNCSVEGRNRRADKMGLLACSFS